MKTIIFLHGALGAASQFDAVCKLLAPQFQCVAIDLPLHGHNSHQSPLSLASYTHYIIDEIEKNSQGKVSIFGYSMGGYIALMVALERPDLIEKVLTLATKLDWAEESIDKQFSMLNPDMMESKIPQYAAYLNQLHHALPWKEVVLNTFEVLKKLIENPPLDVENLSTIILPCRLGIGDRDKMVSVKETMNTYKILKNGSMYMLPDTAHPLENVPAAFIAEQCINFF